MRNGRSQVNTNGGANKASSGRDQRGINFKDRAGYGRAADTSVTAVRSKGVCGNSKYREAPNEKQT